MKDTHEPTDQRVVHGLEIDMGTTQSVLPGDGVCVPLSDLAQGLQQRVGIGRTAGEARRDEVFSGRSPEAQSYGM